MSRHPITVRLPDWVLDGLTYLASQRSISRQDLIEEILTQATADVPITGTNQGQNLPLPLVLQRIQPKIDALGSGEEMSLKRLIGKDEWSRLDDSVRRNLGKDFKELVKDGQFPGLTVGRKKTNNEQQYLKI